MDNPAFSAQKHMYLLTEARINKKMSRFPAGTVFQSIILDPHNHKLTFDLRPPTVFDITERQGIIDYNMKSYVYTGVTIKRFFAGLKPGAQIGGICLLHSGKSFWWDEGEWWRGADIHHFASQELWKVIREPYDYAIPMLTIKPKL